MELLSLKNLKVATNIKVEKIQRMETKNMVV